MEFPDEELNFWASIFLTGSLAGLFRIWRDGDSFDLRGTAGRCFSAGIFSFGIIGFWIGRDTSNAGGGFYYLALAALVGYTAKELQDKVIVRIVTFALEKTGLIDKDNAGDKAQK